MQWGISSGARHNWICFLAYKKFHGNFLSNFLVRTLQYFWNEIKLLFLPQKTWKKQSQKLFIISPIFSFSTDNRPNTGAIDIGLTDLTKTGWGGGGRCPPVHWVFTALALVRLQQQMGICFYLHKYISVWFIGIGMFWPQLMQEGRKSSPPPSGVNKCWPWA